MSSPELAQLEMLAQVDDLLRRLRDWELGTDSWAPLQHARSLLHRVLGRVETLRIRLEAPLVVATFGGTGTGKSALVNALVGAECSTSGRQRPTTTRPVLIAHPDTELAPLALTADDFHIVRRDAPLLRDVVLIDCPDPDTSASDGAGSNLARLRALLPHCDVLLYVSTQQKYKNHRVTEELAQAASGCQLVFVQTNADLDSDIREDWRQHLAPHYAVPEMFFVDSLRALREQQAGHRPTGDFARLSDLLTTRLAAGHRMQIRRANLLDLIQAALEHCTHYVDEHHPALAALEEALEVQRTKLTAVMSQKLHDELAASRSLWERRLITAVTDRWGLSPFSFVLKTYNSLGDLIASSSFFRVRTSAQLAILGAVQGARWWTSVRQAQDADTRLERAATLGFDDVHLREAQLIVAGYAQAAELDPRLAETGTFDALRHEALRVEDQFLADAGRHVELIIGELAARHGGFARRCLYEILLGIFLVYLLGRIGKNFFWDSAVLGLPIITTDFYLPAGIFCLLWAGALVGFFTAGLRRGLDQRIDELAADLAHSRLAAGLFPDLERLCRDARQQRDRLGGLLHATQRLRRELASTAGLGMQTHRPPGVGAPV